MDISLRIKKIIKNFNQKIIKKTFLLIFFIYLFILILKFNMLFLIKFVKYI